MFTASYPARFLAEEAGKGFHARFRDLPEALTGGDSLEETRLEAADCLAEAIAGRIARGDAIPKPSKPKRGEKLVGVPLYLALKLALYNSPHAQPQARHQTSPDPGGAGYPGQAHRGYVRRRGLIATRPLSPASCRCSRRSTCR